MQPQTIARINQINHEFYSCFGAEFSLTRGRIQPGVRRIMETIHKEARVLDVGCGNGEFANALQANGFTGNYVGIDFSAPLLSDAYKTTGTNNTFYAIDLTEVEWGLPANLDSFSVITCFAALHHIVSDQQRTQVIKNIKKYLAPDGVVHLSNWQFLNSEKLAQRVLAWDDHGINPNEVEPNDYLIDWKSGGTGIRYVHHFSQEEVTELASRNGFSVIQSFHSDGTTGNLGIYQSWKIS